MMRTNSRGSVISVEEIAAEDKFSKSPPPAIIEKPHIEELSENSGAPTTTPDSTPAATQVEDFAETQHGTLTPPEIFPRQPGEHVEDVEMEEPAEAATPRPPLSKSSSTTESSSPDPDPTPRPNVMADPLAAVGALQESPTSHRGDLVQSPPSF